MFYNLLRLCLYPFIFLFLVFRPKKIKFVISRIFQSLKKLKKNEKYIWLHCSSVGEINLCDALIKGILLKKNERLLITIFTDTGYETAIKKYGNNEKIDILKFPLDDYFTIKRIVKLIKIKYLLIIETEIWPNLIKLASKRSKIILVNGRISNKSFPKYKKLKFILRGLLNKIDIFCMQTEEDRKRIIYLGANENRVFSIGNLKFDIEFENYSVDEKERAKKKLGVEGRKVIVAGSTREGEDEILLEVYKNLENSMLILVPRHLDRVNKIEELIKKERYSYKKLSEIEENGENKKVDVILVDKMGVLRKFYSIADVAFVGGTMVNIGGHSLIEPLFYGKTPIFGPYIQNVIEIAKEIQHLNLGYKVENIKEFISAVEKIEKTRVSREMIDLFFHQNRNIVENIIKFMEE